jgi:hypothetical protein
MEFKELDGRVHVSNNQNINFMDFSPQANYTDHSAAGEFSAYICS